MSSARCETLLRWYEKYGRALPWRQATDPYHIWISEIMLQQTQVKTVLPRYAMWFERFPTIEMLAKASLDEVLKTWEGLGYYRRARFIYQAAQLIVDDMDSYFPSVFDDIISLPGIGRSTAGAISSFCFDSATAVLDGNVKRVLKRWHAQPDVTDKQLWQMAQLAIETSGKPSSWNQAMMELGAMICSATKPDCGLCPITSFCKSAFSVDGKQAPIKQMKVKDVHWRINLHICPDRGIWLIRRPNSGIWGGLWTPPITELARQPNEKPKHIHLLTHRRLHLYPCHSELAPIGDGCWVASIEGYALPTGIYRLLEKSNFNIGTANWKETACGMQKTLPSSLS